MAILTQVHFDRCARRNRHSPLAIPAWVASTAAGNSVRHIGILEFGIGRGDKEKEKGLYEQAQWIVCANRRVND
jgi:hypothetical protein